MTKAKAPKASTTELIPPGLLDGNGRTARLARWLRDVPKRREVDLLLLEVRAEDGWQRVQAWERSEVGLHLAMQVDASVQDLANETGAYTTARLAWWESGSGTYWLEHALRAHPESMQPGQAHDGGAQSVTIQTQRAAERVLSVFLGAVDTTNSRLERSADLAQQNFEHAQAELVQAREEIARLKRELLKAELERDEAVEVAERIQAEKDAGGDSSGDQLKTMLTGLLMREVAKTQTPPSSAS